MKLLGPGLLLISTAIWGSAFVAQKLGADHFGPFAINSFRNLIGGAFLWLCLLLRNRFCRGDWPVRPNRRALRGGFFCGLLLFAAMISQQIGIERTTPGISAFLTSNYVLIVPLLAWAVGKGRPGLGICLGVLFALAGAYLISVSSSATSGFVLDAGAAWILLCAVFFAGQILVIDRYIDGVYPFRFSMIQFAVCAILNILGAVLTERARFSVSALTDAAIPILYCGILSVGVAYTCQVLGQRYSEPVSASILLSTESVFSAIGGALILHERMAWTAYLGCALIFAGILLSQKKSWEIMRKNLPDRKIR